jgi:hypothetical protein
MNNICLSAGLADSLSLRVPRPTLASVQDVQGELTVRIEDIAKRGQPRDRYILGSTFEALPCLRSLLQLAEIPTPIDDLNDTLTSSLLAAITFCRTKLSTSTSGPPLSSVFALTDPTLKLEIVLPPPAAAPHQDEPVVIRGLTVYEATLVQQSWQAAHFDPGEKVTALGVGWMKTDDRIIGYIVDTRTRELHIHDAGLIWHQDSIHQLFDVAIGGEAGDWKMSSSPSLVS